MASFDTRGPNILTNSRWAGPPVLENGDGGGHDGGMEARIAKLEAAAEFTSKRLDGIEKRIDRVDADLRMMLGGLVGGFLLLAGMLIAGYLKLDERFVRAEGRVTSLEASLAKGAGCLV